MGCEEEIKGLEPCPAQRALLTISVGFYPLASPVLCISSLVWPTIEQLQLRAREGRFGEKWNGTKEALALFPLSPGGSLSEDLSYYSEAKTGWLPPTST